VPVGVVPATARAELLSGWRPAQPRPCGTTVSGGAVTALPSGSGRSGVAKHLRVAPPLPAKPGRALLTHLSVHEAVDDLCKKAASLWASREMLGIVAAAHAHVKAVTWENTIHTLCTKENLRLST
jgi:hypothetical protein